MASLNLTPPARDGTSSASSSSHVYPPFDVFINHRGTDVKEGLASHLYTRLKDHGLRVFLDASELQQGDEINSQIQGAIRTSSVHLAIFSQRYAESTWCLNELVMMLDSDSTIIPVFYGVNPSELRWTREEDGLYARALSILQCILLCTRGEDRVYARDLRMLEMLEKKTTIDPQTRKKKPRYDSKIVEKWRQALFDVSHRSGFELKACNGGEGRLVHRVVDQVLKKVSKAPLYVATHPTGLEENLKEFETTMLSQQQSGDTGVVGIVGLGGVGKSTLAKEFFNRHRSNYDRSCFLYDVREAAAKNSLNLLQATLLKELAGVNEQINGVNEGIDKLRNLSSSCRVLIVLDDADHTEQLAALFLPVKDVIHPRSLIVVTSRNRDVLISSGIPEACIFRLTGLNQRHSRKLFYSHSFGPINSVEEFHEVIDKFLDACRGLPLSLKVIGSLLRGNRDLKHWQAQLHKISKILPNDIQSKLKVSYDSLDEWEKQIFLDIACFFIGEDKDTATRIWDGSGWEGSLGFWKLENRCLVDVDHKNRIRMHDHLRDLGRDLAKREHTGCRLWQPTDNLLYDLSTQSPVRGIMVHLNDCEESVENLADIHLLTIMSSLQLLWAGGYFVERLFSLGHLPQLIYLRWEKCSLSYLPSSISIKKLRVLYLKGQNLVTLWQHESEAPLQLRELHIEADHLKIIPNSIGKLKHLEKFVLHGSDLETLAHSVGNLTSLRSLDLSRCSSLHMLPDSIGQMTSLGSLHLSGCSSLQVLPDCIGQMTSLKSLDLSWCSSLQVIPDSIWQMTSLESLHLSGCSSLQVLTDSIGQMTSLGSLHLSGCYSLLGLPDSIGQMTSLRSLDLSWCYSLQVLPDSTRQMTSLESLHFCGCSSLRVLPDSIGQMTSLRSLDLSWCYSLRVLPDSIGQMTSLESLHLSGCSSLNVLPDSIGQMTSLGSLDLSGCSSLQVLPDSIGQMTSLGSLDLSGCSSLEVLPDSIGQMTSLRSLYLRGCSSLQVLPDSIGQMTSLGSLDLSWCSSLQVLPDSIGQMTSLGSLDLSWCSSLQVLPDSIGQMTILPNSIGQMTILKRLNLNRKNELEELPAVD